MHAKPGWWIVAGVAVAVAAGLSWQFRAQAVSRESFARDRVAARSLAGVRAEHERLLAVQPAAGELERREAEAEALRLARAEVEALRLQVEKAARIAAEKKSAPVDRFTTGATVPASEWKNAGTATAKATLETVLWAGAGGDVDVFAKALFFYPNKQTHDAARSLWESVPESMRANYPTPESLLAFLSVKDVPLGAVKVRQTNELEGWPGPAMNIQLLLTGADGKSKNASLLFMQKDDGWKLVVMESVIAKYAAALKEPEKTASGR